MAGRPLVEPRRSRDICAQEFCKPLLLETQTGRVFLYHEDGQIRCERLLKRSVATLGGGMGLGFLFGFASKIAEKVGARGLADFIDRTGFSGATLPAAFSVRRCMKASASPKAWSRLAAEARKSAIEPI